MQLAPYTSLGEQHGLSINPDVLLWLDFQTFHNNPPLQVVGDFVLVTNELHDEFDKFKMNETQLGISLLPRVKLLEFWVNHTGLLLPTVTKYGKTYFPLNCSQLDDLCSWVRETRERVDSDGQRVFEETCTSALSTEADTLSGSLAASVISSNPEEERPVQQKPALSVRQSSKKRQGKTHKCPVLVQNDGKWVRCRVNS